MHIADVAALVKSGSTVDRDAAYMGCGLTGLGFRVPKPSTLAAAETCLQQFWLR